MINWNIFEFHDSNHKSKQMKEKPFEFSRHFHTCYEFSFAFLLAIGLLNQIKFVLYYFFLLSAKDNVIFIDLFIKKLGENRFG